VDFQDELGETALHKAVWSRKSQCCEVLLSAGASVDIRDEQKGTALHKAATQGDLICMRLLLQHGALPSDQDDAGMTALHRAIANGQREAVNLLLTSKADLETPDNEMRTPLQYAAMRPSCKDILVVLEAEQVRRNPPKPMPTLRQLTEGRHTENEELRYLLNTAGDLADLYEPRLLEIMMSLLPMGMDPTEVGNFVGSLDTPKGHEAKARLVRVFKIVDKGIAVTNIIGDPESFQEFHYQDAEGADPNHVESVKFVRGDDGQWCFAAPVPWRDKRFIPDD